MESEIAVERLSALAQQGRLAIFRALVVAGPTGRCPSDLQEQLTITPSVLSFHLKALRQAGLVQVRQDGRHLYYSADFAAMNALIAYLTENCCAEDPGCCAPPERACVTS
ncbi:metalloregulator ArsR/SmtB family transcription factor [Flagellatimonas centrodinii]|uniref:ArsR/SmtB family transcription factor n=1 Tax=Flagellatimonas centrodinii TaxID=2806210 RepID=UPI001FED4080|nr:metalloregulator ArsR/SmtB family transcription factor [Flagellatimonas centrodinii]ULQ48112.1 metalloregulator ArsR/SmtB family transcription factor [Flagellatimonas centrodinii]